MRRALWDGGKLKNLSIKVNHLKNRHLGERCVLVCNGPSLNKMDLSFLKDETVIGLNKIYLGLLKFKFYPQYYVAVNQKVLEQSGKQIKKMTSRKFLSNRCPGLFQEDCLTHILETQNFSKRFSFDIAEGLHEGWTVTYAALQIAFFLGFTDVIIIGMDHRFDYTGSPNQETIMSQDDNNHFHKDYFKGMKWDNPDLLRSEESYRIAKNIYEKHDRKIIDATLGGACRIFKKVNYKEIFFNELPK